MVGPLFATQDASETAMNQMEGGSLPPQPKLPLSGPRHCRPLPHTRCRPSLMCSAQLLGEPMGHSRRPHHHRGSRGARQRDIGQHEHVRCQVRQCDLCCWLGLTAPSDSSCQPVRPLPPHRSRASVLALYRCRHLYLINLVLRSENDVFHCERFVNLLLRNVTGWRARRAAGRVAACDGSVRCIVHARELTACWRSSCRMPAYACSCRHLPQWLPAVRGAGDDQAQPVPGRVGGGRR